MPPSSRELSSRSKPTRTPPAQGACCHHTLVLSRSCGTNNRLISSYLMCSSSAVSFTLRPNQEASPSHRHRVALRRPGPASLEWLHATLRELQHAVQPVTVAASSPYVLAVVRQRLAEGGITNVRLRVQLRPIAERIARALGSRAVERPLTGPLESAAIRIASSESSEPVLRRLSGNRALNQSLGALFRDLGHLDQIEPVLDALARGGSIGASARRIFFTYRRLTEEFPDVPRQLRIAARYIRESTPDSAWPEELGALLLYLPPRLDAAEREFLLALAERVPLAICFSVVDDPVADAPIRETAEALAAALSTTIANSEANWTRPAMRVLSAPDPEEETRSVVRRLLTDMGDDVPLWRMAVLYTADDPYAPLVRETLDAGNVPWHSAIGRPASGGLAARSLLGLLGLRERGFAREAVLDWLAARPTVPSEESDPLPDVPVSSWDRLSRRAQVVQGAEQWIGRVTRLVKTLEEEHVARQNWGTAAHDGEVSEEVPRPSHDMEHAHSIVTAICTLDRDTR